MTESLMFNPMPTNAALSLFRQTTLHGGYHRFWARLTHRNSRLLELDKTLCCTDVTGSHSAGVRTVSIDRIRGTAGKADAFDEQFHPIKETTRSRWMSIAREKLCGREMPPVELVDVEGVYYVRDGHHRISVARSLGQAFIEAEVTMMSINQRIR